MSYASDRYVLVIAPTARRQLAETLPEAVAVAAHEFIVGPLLDNPHRVGKRLRPPLEDRHAAGRGTYRVIYRVDDEDQSVSVIDVVHPGRRLPTSLNRPRAGRLPRPRAPTVGVPCGHG